jgi:hypothetical protein
VKLIIYIILICLMTNRFRQKIEQKDNFKYEVTKVKGDLNNDSIIDFILVTQDTINVKLPYKLQVYFGQRNGEFKLIVETTKAIQPQFPDGKYGYRTGNRFSDITIKNNVFNINNDLLRGHFEHTFRFQNGHFKLIGFTEVYSDGRGTGTTIDFNLSSGIRLEKSQRYDTDKVLSDTKKKISIRPLPKLRDFEPFKSKLY